MIDRLPESKKSKKIKLLLNEALDILDSVGIPLHGMTARGLERMAVCFLAVAGVSKDWGKTKFATNLAKRGPHSMSFFSKFL